MKFLKTLAMCGLCLWAANAGAKIEISDQVLQSGQFTKPECRSDPKDTDYDECTCDADIHYPQLTGLDDHTVEGKLNSWFKEQSGKAICEGAQVPSAPKDKAITSKAHGSQSVHYQSTFMSSQLTAFKFTEWAYTGGAHGNGSVIGVIVDTATGKLLTPTDIFSTQNIPSVNQAIYNALTAKPEEEIFRDQIESRQGMFIKDGECQGCTLILTPAGIHVLFQTYEVAPYGAGDVDVLIPTKLVSDPAVRQALAMEATPSRAK